MLNFIPFLPGEGVAAAGENGAKKEELVIFRPPLMPKLLLGWRSGRWLGLGEQPGWGGGGERARWGDVFKGVTWLRRGSVSPLPSVTTRLSGSLVP